MSREGLHLLRTLIELGTNPIYPIILATILYLWVCLGFTLSDKPWFAGMWAAYAVANFCLLMHAVTGR